MRSSGQGKIGCLLWLVGAGLFGMILWQALPVKIKTAEFESFIEDQAKFSARATAADIERRIRTRADELDIPLEDDGLDVRKGRDRVRITCSYSIPLEFPFYTYVWEFEHLVDRPIFIF